MRNNYKTKITKLLVLTIFSFTFCNIYNSSALDYQSSTNIGFTFNPTLSISLSSADLVIDNLVPDIVADSNSINISVATNAAYGYTLSAIMDGDNGNLIHNNNIDTFSSIDPSANLETLTVDNTWGYTSKLSSEITWNNYNGLSSSSNTVLLDANNGNNSDNNNNVDSINFKIAAKASNTQPSGEYAGTINFIAVSKVAPMSLLDSFIASGAKQLNGYYKMQDMTHDICESVDIEESELQLIDVRDNKIYWVAKLKDGNCWMTQNLDLDLSHEVALTSETSDINPESYGTTIYTTETGYSKDKDTGVVAWLPSTIDSEGIQRADTIDMVWNSNTSATAPGWTNDNYKPYSADPGNRYMYTNSSTYEEKIYTSSQDCADDNNDYAGCQHTHFGNYYNWSAAVSSNDVGPVANNSIYNNSVCPANWALPKPNEYNLLLRTQGVLSGSGYNYADNGLDKIRTNPLYFTRSGVVDNSRVAWFLSQGSYWTNMAHTKNGSYNLSFEIRWAIPDTTSYYGGRYGGFPVRCLAR